MKLEIKSKALIIIPETDHDRSYLLDTLNINSMDNLKLEKVIDVKLGFHVSDDWVLKISKKEKALDVKQD